MDDVEVSNFWIISFEALLDRIPVAEKTSFNSELVFIKKFLLDILPSGLFRFKSFLSFVGVSGKFVDENRISRCKSRPGLFLRW